MFNNQTLNIPLPRTLYPDKCTTFPYVFVADEAYGLHKHMMKPFAKVSLTKQRRIYNYRLSRARRIVECAFGMMAKKFRVFQVAMLVHPNVTKHIVLACCVLHNVIREKEGKLSEVFDEIMNLHEDCDLERET